jgi:hypothetical protein
MPGEEAATETAGRCWLLVSCLRASCGLVFQGRSGPSIRHSVAYRMKQLECSRIVDAGCHRRATQLAIAGLNEAAVRGLCDDEVSQWAGVQARGHPGF